VASAARETIAVFDGRSGQTIQVPRYRRHDLVPGARFAGPAIVAEDETATYVTAAFDGWIDGIGSIVMDRKEQTA
jgi:N-methylhydantoinase A